MSALGDNDRTIEWLEKAYEDGVWLMGLLKVEPLFDPLRSDPLKKTCFDASVRRNDKVENDRLLRCVLANAVAFLMY